MSWEEDLRTRAITAGVAEFHWGEAPQGTELPYAVATVVSDPRPEHLKGYIGMRRSRVQIDCYARTVKAAAAMAETLVAGLSDPATVGGTRFGRCVAEGPTDQPGAAAGKTIHRRMLQFFITHRAI